MDSPPEFDEEQYAAKAREEQDAAKARIFYDEALRMREEQARALASVRSRSLVVAAPTLAIFALWVDTFDVDRPTAFAPPVLAIVALSGVAYIHIGAKTNNHSMGIDSDDVEPRVVRKHRGKSTAVSSMLWDHGQYATKNYAKNRGGVEKRESALAATMMVFLVLVIAISLDVICTQ